MTVSCADASPWMRFGFTRREADVAGLLVCGLSNKAMASLLNVTLATIKSHVSAILRKTESDNRTAAALRLRRLEFDLSRVF